MRTLLPTSFALLLSMSGLIAPSALAQEAADSEQEPSTTLLDIEVGKAIVIQLPYAPSSVSITDPNIANQVAIDPRDPTRWQIQGLAIGSTDLTFNASGRKPEIYEINVHRDLSDLTRRVRVLAAPNPPKVYPMQGRIVVDGDVADLDTLERVALVARTYDPEFINLMRVRGDHQVQIDVLFAEVSRTATKSLGVNLAVAIPSVGSFGSVTGIMDSPSNGLMQLPLATDKFNLFGLISAGVDIGFVLQMLDSFGVAKIKAKPTLVALSGQSAEFHSGGSQPIPVPNAQGTPSIKFRDFGVGLKVVPTVLSGDVIDLQIGVSMSALDYANSIQLFGSTIPGFRERRVNTHVRMASGMTFAVAGLLEENQTSTRSQAPGLGAIPIIGSFFRNVSRQQTETEMMVYVTPHLVRPMGAEEIPPLPYGLEENNPNDLSLFFMGRVERAPKKDKDGKKKKKKDQSSPEESPASPRGDVGMER